MRLISHAQSGVKRLTLFQAGSGEARELGTKLGDYLLEQGYELSHQGANVVQLAPGKAIVYKHNKFSNLALEKRGVKVLTFEGKYMADSLGGPHCLTMPLVREENPKN